MKDSRLEVPFSYLNNTPCSREVPKGLFMIANPIRANIQLSSPSECAVIQVDEIRVCVVSKNWVSLPLGAQKLYENGGINITKEKADKWNTRLQHHEFQVLANNTAKTASLDAVRAFVDAQAQTAITCW